MKDRLKKYTLRFAIAFFIVLAVLTYFSSTIDNMLLPKVKIVDVQLGTISGENNSMKTKYLLPLSSVTQIGESGSVFVINSNDSGKTTVMEVPVDIDNSDDLYYEVTSESLMSNMQIVYQTTKSISDGDRVYVEEE